MATPYLIRKGDTLQSIAKANNTTLEAITKVNPIGGSAIKSPNVLVQGQYIHLPEVVDSTGAVTTTPKTAADNIKSVTPTDIAPETPSITGGAPGAVTPGALPSSDWSAGFSTYMTEMGNIGKSVQQLNQQSLEASGAIQNPDGTWNYNPTAAESAQHEQNLKVIQQNAARSTGEVEAAATVAEQQSAKAGELLGLGPAAVKYKIDQYQAQNNQLFKSIADSFAQINQDMNTAMINEDYTYAANLQQEKLQLIATQRQALTDQSSFMTTAFNAMLGVKQEQRLESSDAITKVQNLYSLGQVPSTADWNAAGFSGNPPKALDLAVWSAPYTLDGKMVQSNKQTGEIKVLSIPYFQTLAPADQQRYIDSWVTDVIDNPNDLSKISDETLRNEVNAQVQQTYKDQAAANVANKPPSILDNIMGFFGHSNTPAQVTVPSSTPSGVNSDNTSIQNMATQMDSITPPTD